MDDLLATVRSRVIGEGRVIATPFGPRRMTYVDHAASGRAYRPIEDFLASTVLPLYANTHTETTATGAQTNAFREEARSIIKAATGCTGDDVAIFTGNGATGAVHTLVGCLGLALPCCFKDRYGACIPDEERPVVFVGAYEHHSNEIPWRESEVDVEVVRECSDGGVDLDHLDDLLARYEDRRLKIGSFSAASNVTGRLTNVDAVARYLHHRGALAFFDYAAAGPYVDIRMNPPEDPLAYKDAVFLSMHKFLGGPGSPGVLLAKRHLFENRVPAVPGGGTVSFVTPSKHVYLSDVEHREEGGTPNIPGSIRAGLAMQLKQVMSGVWPDGRPYDCDHPTYEGGVPYGKSGVVGTFPPRELRSGGVCAPDRVNAILAHEQGFARRTIAAFRAEPTITVLGDDAPRLGIVSILVHHTAQIGGSRTEVGPDGLVYQSMCASTSVCKFLHHNFVVALLNDLFGIQARGGNSCAAPFSHRLLGVGKFDEEALEETVAAGYHGCKPGWTRLSFGWYDSEDTLAFVIQAVRFIANFGWRLLDMYDFNPKSGTWRYRGGQPPLLSLTGGPDQGIVAEESERWAYLDAAMRLLEVPVAAPAVELTPFEHVRWFWLPGEVK